MQVIFSDLIAPQFIRFIAPATLFIVGIIVEKRYVGRVSLFSNAVSLFLFYYGLEMSKVLGWIVNCVIILGVVAGIAYATNTRIPGLYRYDIAWIGSSVVTGACSSTACPYSHGNAP